MPEAQDCEIEIISDHRCELGEGPLYDPETNTGWWLDIVGRKLFEKRFDDGTETSHHLPFMASVIARAGPGRQLVVGESGIFLRSTKTHNLELLTHLEADKPKNRSNDGRLHQSGALWIGTMSKTGQAGEGAIYWYHLGELRLLYDAVSIPNCICFSPDRSTAYFADSAVGIIHRVTVSPDDGYPLEDPHVFYDHSTEAGAVDGAIVDRNGLLWNAVWGTGTVDVYSPDGKRMKSIATPFDQVTCPAAGGPMCDCLFLTTARQGQPQCNEIDGKTAQLYVPFEGQFEPQFPHM